MKGETKYIILLGDGMADTPIESLGGKTPLEYAPTPNMDSVAQKGVLGLVRTVPAGMIPGSDTANLSVFGYDPAKYYTGRAPLEALNMNIDMKQGDAAFRCNIVDAEGGVMRDFSAGHIDSALTKIVINEAAKELQKDGIELYPGVSYRNIIIWRNYPYESITQTTPPHDISDKAVSGYLPAGPGGDVLIRIMENSRRIFASSKAIAEAKSKYAGKPESLWIWGGGRKPALSTLEERFGLHGFTISAVDLINGIGRAAGLSPYRVDGATGYLDTNYAGKVEGLFECLKQGNFVYLHVEAPDESGHEGNIEHKLQAIEDFDKKVVGPVLEGLNSFTDYALLIMPDHPTPLKTKTHSDAPVPFCMYRTKGFGSELGDRSAKSYDEKAALATGLFLSNGERLIELMINGRL